MCQNDAIGLRSNSTMDRKKKHTTIPTSIDIILQQIRVCVFFSSLFALKCLRFIISSRWLLCALVRWSDHAFRHAFNKSQRARIPFTCAAYYYYCYTSITGEANHGMLPIYYACVPVRGIFFHLFLFSFNFILFELHKFSFFSPDFVICDGILWLCFIFSDWTYPGIFHIFGNLKQNQYVVYLFYPGYIHQQFILSVDRISFVIMLYIFPLDECTLYAPICFEPNHYMKV